MLIAILGGKKAYLGDGRIWEKKKENLERERRGERS